MCCLLAHHNGFLGGLGWVGKDSNNRQEGGSFLMQLRFQPITFDKVSKFNFFS